MIQQQLTIPNKLGLHTRAAAKLVDVAKKFESHIDLKFRDRIVDGKSIMGVITLGAQKGNVIEVIITGEDEAPAFEALAKLIEQKFGED
jgi:phosphocarrier protein HPr